MPLAHFAIKQIVPPDFVKDPITADRTLFQTDMIVHAFPVGNQPPNQVRWVDNNGTNISVPASSYQTPAQAGTDEWTVMTAAYLVAGIPDGPCFLSAWRPGLESPTVEGKFC